MTSRRKQYTAAFKLQVIKAAEETNNCAAAREFSINEKLVRDWRKVSHKLNNMPKRKCNQRSGVVKCPELEKKLVEWVLQNRECGYCVTRDAIRMHALKCVVC